MKNIIKTSICLIVIASILLCSSVSLAASSDTTKFSITTVNQNTNTANAELINQILPSTEDNRSNTTAIYELNLNPMIQVSMVDGYLNGYVRYLLSCTVGSISQGVWYVDNWDISVNQSDFNSFYHSMRYRTANSYDGIVYFDNYWPIGGTASNVTFGTLTIRVTIHDLQGSYPPASIPINVNGTIETAYYNFSANPVSQNQGGVIKQAILDALDVSDLDTVYSLLRVWKTAQEAYLADIELSVDDLENIITALAATVGDIYSVDVDTYNKISNIYTLLSVVFPSYSNTVLSRLSTIIDRLDTIINQNASDTVAESQMQNAEQQLSQAVNDMEVQKPNINNVVNAGDQYMDSNITGAQGDTFFWLHGTNIFVTILTMAVTIGILGFVIYGKSG